MEGVMRDTVQNLGLRREVVLIPDDDADTFQLDVLEQIVLCDCTAASIAALYLPPVIQAKGKIYIIEEMDDGTNEEVVIKPYEGIAGAPDSTIMTAAGSVVSHTLTSNNAWACYISNGRKWFALNFDLDV